MSRRCYTGYARGLPLGVPFVFGEAIESQGHRICEMSPIVGAKNAGESAPEHLDEVYSDSRGV